MLRVRGATSAREPVRFMAWPRSPHAIAASFVVGRIAELEAEEPIDRSVPVDRWAPLERPWSPRIRTARARTRPPGARYSTPMVSSRGRRAASPRCRGGYHVPVFGRPLLIEDPDEIKFFSQVARFYRGALSEEETS